MSWLSSGISSILEPIGSALGYEGTGSSFEEMLPSIGNMFTGGGSSSSGGHSIIDSLSTPEGLGSLLTSGVGLLQGMQTLDAEDRKNKLDQETNKMNAMIELAKLKYGSHGGGGGSGSAGLTRAIEALELGKKGKSDALTGLMSGYLGAYK